MSLGEETSDSEPSSVTYLSGQQGKEVLDLKSNEPTWMLFFVFPIWGTSLLSS